MFPQTQRKIVFLTLQTAAATAPTPKHMSHQQQQYYEGEHSDSSRPFPHQMIRLTWPL
jgi:hypothetical protein